MSEISNLVKDVVSSPLGDIIASVGQGVADAQAALDEGSLAKTLEIYSEGGEELMKVLKEIGYLPTFYTLPETIGEVKLALKLGGGSTNNAIKAPINTVQPGITALLSRTGLNVPGIRPKMYATPVDAGYSNRYNYQADISAKLTFKIVPVPPPAGMDELRIMPNVVGSTVIDATARLEDLDLDVSLMNSEGIEITEAVDTALVVAQDPAFVESSANIVRAGNKIILTMSE